MRKILVFVILVTLFLGMVSCDRRTSAARFNEPPVFTSDMTIIKDLSTRLNLIDISLYKDGQPFSGAVVNVGPVTVQNSGGEIYYIRDYFALPSGFMEISIESENDNYHQVVPLLLPDSFGVNQVSPRNNTNGDNVFVDWSASNNADYYILAVATANFGFDGSIPFDTLLTANHTSLTVPFWVFEDAIGEIVDGVYYIYIIGFNEGFGPYGETRFQIPDDLPVRITANPVGTLKYGTIAPQDSIIVAP